MSGIKEGIQVKVQASRPTTLSAAIGLARLYEARLQSQRRTFTPDAKKTPMSSPMPHKSCH